MRDPLNARALARGDLRLDRGNALYVSARPFDPSPLFTEGRRGALYTLRLAPSALPALAAALSRCVEDALCGDLQRLADRPVTEDEMSLIESCLKNRLLGLSPDEKALRRTAAAALRQGGGGGMYLARLLQTGIWKDALRSDVEPLPDVRRTGGGDGFG